MTAHVEQMRTIAQVFLCWVNPPKRHYCSAVVSVEVTVSSVADVPGGTMWLKRRKKTYIKLCPKTKYSREYRRQQRPFIIALFVFYDELHHRAADRTRDRAPPRAFCAFSITVVYNYFHKLN